MKRRVVPIGLIGVPCILAFALAGCGLKGPLYLPDEARNIETRPAPPPNPNAPSSPETVDSPDTPPSPAPEVTAPTGTTPPEKTSDDGTDEDKNGTPPR
jgi:predicted small lipoprotein YifL